MEKVGYPAKYADRSLLTEARNFPILEKENVQLFPVVYYEEGNRTCEKYEDVGIFRQQKNWL